jgi:2-dehydropantoate 2-reductase
LVLFYKKELLPFCPQETAMRICIAGAGAIGGVLAVRLAQAGHEVSVLARGKNLAAIRAQGLRLNEETAISLAASDEPAFGPQDIVFIAVKAHSLEALLPSLPPLLGPQTILVPTLNGIPWWYFQGQADTPWQGEAVRAVDPQGRLLSTVDWRMILGAVAYMTAEVATPGHVIARPPYRLMLGEPAHTTSERLNRLSSALDQAGIQAVSSPRIRDEIWTKLVANLASNPLSVVAGATLEEMFGPGELQGIVQAIMREAVSVAACYGARITVDPWRLLELGRQRGAFRTSTLQDYEMGRPLELAGIGDAVVELAARYEVPMPTTRMVLSLARFRARKSAGEIQK